MIILIENLTFTFQPKRKEINEFDTAVMNKVQELKLKSASLWLVTSSAFASTL